MDLSFLKAHFILKITYLQKNEEEKLKVVDAQRIRASKVMFRKSLEEDFHNKKKRQIEFVDKEPENFIFNVIYIRKDGKYVYIFTEK